MCSGGQRWSDDQNLADFVSARALAEGLDAYLAAVRRVPGSTPSIETARLMADRDAHRIAYRRPAGMIVSNSYVVGSGIETPVRIYRPFGEGAQPAIVYFHGGGFTTGSIESYDGLATALAEASGATVVSVHYARLPESTPRATLEECYEVLLWTGRMAGALRIDAQRLAIAGDSAGAFIATHLAMLARDRRGPNLLCQLLCYGVFDLDPDRGDYARSQDPVMTQPVLQGMIAAYRSRSAEDCDPVVAPLTIDDLSHLPPATLLGAEHDAMRAEGHAYADRLRRAGVEVEERISPGMCHGFLRAVGLSQRARDEMLWLGAAFRGHLQ